MIVKITMIAAVTALVSLVLKQYRPEYTLLLQVGACAGILVLVLSNYSEVTQKIQELGVISKVGGSSVKALLKVLGIALITQFASDLCRDSGETALAGSVETAGKWIILLYSLPFLEAISRFAVNLLKDI